MILGITLFLCAAGFLCWTLYGGPGGVGVLLCVCVCSYDNFNKMLFGLDTWHGGSS